MGSNITREQILNANLKKFDGYKNFIPYFSQNQLDALYSDDIAKINEAFLLDDFSVIKNGIIYDIYWLASHTPEEYDELELRLYQIQAVFDKQKNNSNCDHETAIIERNIYSYSQILIEREFAFDAQSDGGVLSETDNQDSLIDIGQGSEIERFIYEYDHRFYAIGNEFIIYVGEEAFNIWKSEVRKNGYNIPTVSNFLMQPDFNIKYFIEYFNIDKETLKTVLGSIYDPMSDGSGWKLNNLQINALYSDDPEELFNAFPGEYAFFYNGKPYAPIWLMTHTPEEYLAEEMPLELIYKVLVKWKEEQIFRDSFIELVKRKAISYKHIIDMQSVTEVSNDTEISEK